MYTAKMTEVHDIAKKLKDSNQLKSFLHITPTSAPSTQPAPQAPRAQADKSDT